ncbi:uncharacterized protein LOC143981357 [Lithobates pipiens]
MRARFRGVDTHTNKTPVHTYWWLEHLVEKVSGTMAPLPCTYLKCTSMIMDTINFSINYSIPFIPNLLRTPQELPNPAAAKTTSQPQQSFNSIYQISQSSFGHNNTSAQMLNKRSNVKMILQYLGTGFSITNEMINPKDEVSMFQQICGGESICVFKGYLSPGEKFQMVSRRHYGYTFSASIYINGLIAARISACCEYRYRVGFQQGRRGCFRITELSGGKPCHRCGFHYDQKMKTEGDHSVSSTCEESATSQERVSEIKNKTEKTSKDTQPVASHCLSLTTLGTQPCLQKRKVKKKKKRWPQQNESESEQENRQCNKNSKHRRPPGRDSRRGQQPDLLVQSNSNTGKNDIKAKLWNSPVAHTTSEDATAVSTVKEKKFESPSPRSADSMGDNAQRQHQTARLEHAKSAVTIKPSRARKGLHNGGRIQTEEDSIQEIHHRLARALSEAIRYSEVELSDSSDSTDIYSIAEEQWIHKMISSDEVTQPKLDQQVTAGRKEIDNGDEDARSGPVMSATEESTLHKIDQQVAAERNEEKDGGDDARSGPITSSNQESTLQELDKQVAAESEMSPSGNSTLQAAAPITEESDGEIHETAERADEEGLLSQITDLIAVLQESDEVHQLVLRNTGMTDALLQRLMPAIIVSHSEVESINLNLNEIGPGGAEKLIQLLKEKPCIQSLLLYGNQLEDKGIKSLLCGLSEILITQQRMDTTLSYGMPLVQLSELDIGGNHMSAEALRTVAEYLKLNPFLKHLGLAHVSVHSPGAWQELFEALKINTNLTHLLLDENGLGDGGVRLLAEVIQVNRSLVTIDLDGNDISEEGGGAIAEGLASTTDVALKSISLDNNYISEGTIAAIQRLLMLKCTHK